MFFSLGVLAGLVRTLMKNSIIIFFFKGPIRICHSVRKTNFLKLDFWLKEGILCGQKNPSTPSIANEHMEIFSLCSPWKEG